MAELKPETVVGMQSESVGDEIDTILDALARLAGTATRPFIRVCLEEAYCDIAHLACRDDRLSKRDGEQAAA